MGVNMCFEELSSTTALTPGLFSPTQKIVFNASPYAEG
jgi:hypothetical protein